MNKITLKKASLLSTHVDAKQGRDDFQQPHSCDFFSVLCPVAVRSSRVRSLFLNLGPYDGNNPDGMFPLFYKQVAWKLTLKSSVILRHLVK